MHRILQIFKKEFKSYFISPVAYIVISIFLLVTGWFFFSSFFLYNQASLRGFFSLLPFTFSFVIPAVTMRLISEELNVGSYETLLTLPVLTLDVVLGKFFAAVGFVAVMLVPTLFYSVSISFLGDLDWGPVVGGTLGALLMGAAFSAVGIFASSLTRNQIIAYIVGLAICFALTLIDKMLFFLPSRALAFFQYMGADAHFQNFAKGVLDSRDILYFLSVCFIALYGTSLTLQERD
ncbi:MAG: ABC transporter permease subunit [Proteobacteria bacterium]|nr:ABC transporter permease subunit [Desulfobacteraceae bacterium]MBU4001081.1 ABC transporter permease subunit [Pseudomonadota bacterium]MBU4054690.1 ABC transporter permease subunit [Pseudomonadota bacterium]MBU4318042.1 ABC transporter permease subunit [Pseudomonadota bacterium]MBU4469466.1 ABC transporter permease subunit [Pseudomonadota bacterium]